MARKDFSDRLTHPLPGPRDIMRIMLRGGFTTWRSARPGVADDVPRQISDTLPPAGGLQVTWVGHATNVVRLDGVTLVTDPVWNPRLPGHIRRVTPPGVPQDAVRPDAILLSHNHYDHTDRWTLRRFDPSTPVYCGLGMERMLASWGMTDVRPLDWWQHESIIDAVGQRVKITFVPAHHWSRRTPWDENKSLWGGWVAEGDAGSTYFAGDTAYGDWFKEIQRRVGAPDVAMLPIGAYDPKWFMQHVHMDPDEAVQAFLDLEAGHLSTMHWGTYVLTREPILEPLERVRAAFAAAGLPQGRLWDLAIGETRRVH